ncbi:DNA double-strand break repair Rad50 ATPase [Pyrococcus horikoshii OT3] [Rhizoctonia solani]|uniref:DNA double-strand break repair Rad50 ATPase [Pyrococcus horikoshii OT3] n=1 Tax=Rhizoctonia solani TaxID=456999 RepID=A0A0K6FZ32_9AGAM|nr:DNA double-strand break repair Rad50 ATPase [Pyrococcus horikoshii OT3] [Rhizoctonia solani]
MMRQHRVSKRETSEGVFDTSACPTLKELDKQGSFHLDRFRSTGELEDLEKSIQYRARALALTAEGHPDIPTRLASLGEAYTDRFERLDQLEDLEKSIEFKSRALALTPAGHPDMPDRLAYLGVSYINKFQRLGGLEDLEVSIEHFSRALELTPKDHPDMPRRLANLAVSYGDRYQHLGQIKDLEKAIECDFGALALTPNGHPDMRRRLANLAVSYGDRFQRLGELEDLDKAIECESRALELTPEGHPDTPLRLGYLGVSYNDRFQRLGEPRDLEKAIELYSRALELTPEGHPDMPERLASLGVAYADQFQHLNQPDDLEKSIAYNSRALALTPEGHPRIPEHLTCLGVAYGHQFQRLGDLEDLDKSIGHLSHALALTPESHPQLSDRLARLGVSYIDRYRHLAQTEDLDSAIECFSRALLITPEGHSDMPLRLATLGAAHSDRFQRLGQLDDLEKAIEHESRALALTPEGHPHMPRRFAELGVSYNDRFRCLNRMEDLEKSIEHKSRAIALTSESHPYMPVRLASLGVSYGHQYERLGRLEDLEKSIQHYSHALALTPEDHPDISRLHHSLAITYLFYFQHTGDLSYSNRSLESFRVASHNLAGAPRSRFQYALEWAKFASKHSPLNPVEAYEVTIDLLPQFIWLGATTSQRYQDLSTVENLAVNAASVAILASEYSLALEWLEHARCVVWNQSLTLRSPLDELHSFHPEIAVKLQAVANQLHGAGSAQTIKAHFSDSINLEQVGQERRRLAREYQGLLSETRQLPGFENFLQPIKATTLMRVARIGPIIVINCHEDRCDALLVLPGHDDISYLHLPDFTYDKAQRARSDMEESYTRTRSFERSLRRPQQSECEGRIEDMLATLWTDIVKPILDFLGYTNNVSRDNLPHITWCPTGALSFLPLHAAGDYNQPGAQVFEYAISSYTPMLTALLDFTPSSLSDGFQVLGIGQANSPGHNSLPGTVRELASLKAHIQNNANYSELVDDQATKETVLNAMEQHDWVHLACHAHQDTQDPTKSGFYLHDDALDLATINRRSFKNKGLAFLSACQTATGDKKLPDEAIHLASGMLMAGYRSVIATMWSVVDEDAPLVADKVYEQLMKDGGIGSGEAGRALHYAVVALRERVGVNEFGRWVPYIHIGT